MHFTLRQLQVFLAIAHHQNVTRAASALAMSQSACSSALKDLEQQYDVQLFDRVGKRLQTNELGQAMRAKAEALIDQAKLLERTLLDHRDIGELKIGATLTIGNYLAVELIRQFMQDSPGARAHLDVANTETIAHEILNFDIDIGLIEGEYHHPDLNIIAFRDDELVCFSHPDHPLASKRKISDKDLQSAAWILREPGSGTRQTFDRAMSGLLPQLNILLELQHTEAIKRAVEANLGIACLSKISLEQAFERKSLVPLNVQHRNFKRQFYFVLHKEKYRTEGIIKWAELCDIKL